MAKTQAFENFVVECDEKVYVYYQIMCTWLYNRKFVECFFLTVVLEAYVSLLTELYSVCQIIISC